MWEKKGRNEVQVGTEEIKRWEESCQSSAPKVEAAQSPTSNWKRRMILVSRKLLLVGRLVPGLYRGKMGDS